MQSRLWYFIGLVVHLFIIYANKSKREHSGRTDPNGSTRGTFLLALVLANKKATDMNRHERHERQTGTFYVGVQYMFVSVGATCLNRYLNIEKKNTISGVGVSRSSIMLLLALDEGFVNHETTPPSTVLVTGICR